MTQEQRDTALAIAACKTIIDGRDPERDMAGILVTAEHAIAALLLMLMRDPRKAAAMLNEGLCPGVESRLGAEPLRPWVRALRSLAGERDALRKERDEAREANAHSCKQWTQAIAERDAARAQVAALIASLEPIERAVEAIESVDPLCPDECAALRANFDYWMRNLGRDNSEEVNRDSVRFGDLKRLRDLRRAALAATEGEKR